MTTSLELSQSESAVPSILTAPRAVIETDDHTQITILDYFDVIAPSPDNSVKGHLMKGVLKTLGKKRRISLEIHRMPISRYYGEMQEDGKEEKKPDLMASILRRSPSTRDAFNGGAYVKKAFIRISKRASKSGISGIPSKGAKISKSSHDLDNDGITSLQDESSVGSFATNTSDHSLIDFPAANTNNNPRLSVIYESQTGTSDTNNEVEQSLGRGEKWITKYKVPLAEADIEELDENRVTLSLYDSAQKRKLYFDSSFDAEEFRDLFTQNKTMDEDYSMANFREATAGLNIDDDAIDQKIDFLIDIVGAEKISVAGEIKCFMC